MEDLEKFKDAKNVFINLAHKHFIDIINNNDKFSKSAKEMIKTSYLRLVELDYSAIGVQISFENSFIMDTRILYNHQMLPYYIFNFTIIVIGDDAFEFTKSASIYQYHIFNVESNQRHITRTLHFNGPHNPFSSEWCNKIKFTSTEFLVMLHILSIVINLHFAYSSPEYGIDIDLTCISFLSKNEIIDRNNFLYWTKNSHKSATPFIKAIIRTIFILNLKKITNINEDETDITKINIYGTGFYFLPKDLLFEICGYLMLFPLECNNLNDIQKHFTPY